jgi:predicted regulator of Ras-like GTPase activity (Roadblock/LC7/MglB family)
MAGADVKDLLRGLVAGIEGTAGATIVGMDGTMVDMLRVDQGFALDQVAHEGAVAGKVLDYLCQKVEGGALDHIMLVAEHYIIILAMAGADHYVALAMNPRGNVGKARLQLRRFMPELASALTSRVM